MSPTAIERQSEKLAVMARDVQYIKDTVSEMKSKLERDYVERNEFEPVKSIVYGLVGLILIAVVGAIIALVIKQVE